MHLWKPCTPPQLSEVLHPVSMFVQSKSRAHAAILRCGINILTSRKGTWHLKSMLVRNCSLCRMHMPYVGLFHPSGHSLQKSKRIPTAL